MARETDRAFREQWDEAREDAIDTLEAVAWQRARDSSDYLLWKLLQSNRRSLYSDKVAVGGDEGGPVLVRVVYDDPDLYKLDTPTRARDEWQSGIASHGDEAPELELIDGNAGEASCSGRQQYQPTR